MNVLRNLAFYLAFYAGSALFVLTALVALAFRSPRFEGVCEAWSRWHRGCCRWLLGIRVKVVGQQPAGPVLYAIKHEAFFEAIDILTMFRRPAGFAKQELFAIPGWGRTAQAYGAIPVARDLGASALRQMVRDVQPFVAQQRPIVIFPEGTRVPHGHHAPLQSGFAALYKLLGLPVVPVAVNSGPLYHRTWKRPGTITLHFGEPIEPGLPRPEIEARVRAAINCLNPPQPLA